MRILLLNPPHIAIGSRIPLEQTSPAGPAFDRGPLIDAGHDVGLLDKIKKGCDTTTDREAIRLMRLHGIISLATWVADFEEVTDRDLLRCLRQLVSYDADQITTMFVTAHRWTEYVKNWLSRVKHDLKSSSG